MSNALTDDQKKMLLSHIRDVNDFPQPGIVFKDITPLLASPQALNMLMDHLTERYLGYDLDYVAGIDARGFIFGSILADRLGVGFIPIRKKDKLPFTTITQKYSLEYGFDEIEVHIDAFGEKKGAKVLLIDDLIATGGTAKAANELIKVAGAQCVETCFIIELKFLNGRTLFKDDDIYSVIEY
ncbi:MAG: adenine phosphoribosyltransferase [Campylobacterales bacterium]|nr:adenine phosphoribosyltransferase [Campylobacterales bacterium]